MASTTSIQKKQGNRKLAVKILVGIAALTLSVFLGLWIYWSINKKEIIRNKLEDTIREKTAGLYYANYDDLDLDETGGLLWIRNINVSYDSAKYNTTADAEKPGILLKLFLPELSVNGVKTTKAMAGKKIVGKKLHIRDPYIQVFYTNKGKDSRRNIPSSEIYRQLLGDLELIQLDSFEVSNARIVTYNMESKRDSVVFTNANIRLGGLAIDSVSNLDSSRIFFSKSMDFEAEKIDWSSRSGLYEYTINDLKLNSDNKNLMVSRVDIQPLLNEAAFAKHHKFQTDRLDITLNNIRLAGVDFNRLTNEIVVADRLDAGNVSIKVYRDLRLPFENKTNNCYPNQLIGRIPIPFTIRQASVPALHVELKEVSGISGQTGIVQFTNSRLIVDNISNETSTIRKNGNCRVKINTSLLNLTPMQATLDFALGVSNGNFSVSGTTGSAEATRLNKITEPMGMARIREGFVNSIQFDLRGDYQRASGNVTVLYKDLKIDLLELDEDKPSGVDKKDVSSFLENLLIKDDNPRRNDEVRVITVNHERDMRRSFYNLVWKTILEGINLSIGNKKKMKNP